MTKKKDTKKSSTPSYTHPWRVFDYGRNKVPVTQHNVPDSANPLRRFK